MKPMLVSLVIVFLFLPWASGNFGDQTANLVNDKGNITINNELYQTQLNGDTVTVTKSGATIATFTATASEIDRRFLIGNDYYVLSYEKAGGFIFTSPEHVKFARVVALLPEGVSLPLFGNEFGWLGWYLIISIPVMLLVRKSLKINI